MNGNPNLPRSPLSLDGLSNNSNNIRRGGLNNSQLIPGPKADREHIHMHQVSAHDTVRIHRLKEQRILIILLLGHIRTLDQIPPLHGHSPDNLDNQLASGDMVIPKSVPGVSRHLELVCARVVLFPLDLAPGAHDSCAEVGDEFVGDTDESELVAFVESDAADTGGLQVLRSRQLGVTWRSRHHVLLVVVRMEKVESCVCECGNVREARVE